MAYLKLTQIVSANTRRMNLINMDKVIRIIPDNIANSKNEFIKCSRLIYKKGEDETYVVEEIFEIEEMLKGSKR